jgi:hypothetical protein
MNEDYFAAISFLTITTAATTKAMMSANSIESPCGSRLILLVKLSAETILANIQQYDIFYSINKATWIKKRRF